MLKQYIDAIREFSKENYMQMTKPAEGQLKYPYIVPGSTCYSTELWDWDTWLSDIAVRQIMLDNENYDERYVECEKGCILNFFDHAMDNGRIPLTIKAVEGKYSLNTVTGNCHKPCLAQHALFISKCEHGDVEWLRPYRTKFRAFINYYRKNFRHSETGLYFWWDDGAIGVDNDPCTFYRPPKSSGSVYLNCLMYKELLATAEVLENFGEEVAELREEAQQLKVAMQEHMWDERNGFYYSVDFNLLPIDTENCWLHRGGPRHYDCLIQKHDVWSGFMAMWAGIATPEQAERMVKENLLNEGLFWADYGVRTLSPKEKMYRIVKTGNPSCWQGPIWGISNYMTFRGLVNYGFDAEAVELAKRTIKLFGEDILRCGTMHEYYHPDTGEGVNNPGFQNWNLLVNNMIAWVEGRELLHEV